MILPNELKTDGAILVFQLKSIDFIQRDAEFIEKTTAEVVEQVSAIAQLLVK